MTIYVVMGNMTGNNENESNVISALILSTSTTNYSTINMQVCQVVTVVVHGINKLV